MRKLATFAGAFAVGIFLAQYLLPTNWLLPCAGVALALALGRLFLKGKWGRRVLLVGVGLSLAFGYDWLYIRQIQAPAEALADTERSAAMTLCDYASATSYGAKVTVRIDGVPGKAVYYGDDFLLGLRPGQTVTDIVRLQSAARIRDTDVTTFTSKGVFLLAYNKGTAEAGEGNQTSPHWWPVRLGHAMRQRIAAMFDGDAAGFLTGILTGDKSALSEQAASDLSEAGLYHLLAVSGMHCGFLLIVVQSLAGRHRRRLVAACAIPLLVFYAMLAGGSPSVTRACVMLAFLLAAPLFHRDSDGPTALTAALLLILLKNPFAAASVSLQLSFGAMAGILWLTGPLYWMLLGGKKRGRVYRFIASSFSATMDALALTIPISAWYFGIVVLISPLSNLLCLWFASVVFMAGLIAVLVSFAVPFLGMVLGILPGLFIRYILAAAHLLANIPYHAVYTTNPYLKYWLAFAYLLFILAWLGKPKIPRKYALATVLTALALVVTVCLGKARYQSAMDAIVLDVGQGESVLLASDGAFALVDCGSANSWYDAGGIAADHLMSMGCKRLDYLLLSHYDSDHVNGVECLLSRLPVETLLVPSAQDDAGLQASVSQLAENHGVTVRYITDLEELSLGRAHLTVYPPVGEDEDNDQGLSLLATAGETDLLLTGDMDAATERKLLASYDLPDVEYLVAGHHGSKYSTSADLLDAVTPEAVCISVGTNSYGHPADETVRRVAERGCAIYRTDMHGNIHLIFN